MTQPVLDPTRWRAIALVGDEFFMTVLDVSIVNVALPTIQTHLHFSDKNLQWIISAYAIAFGGFLLLGGRAADLLGRRRVFVVGVALFTIASLLCGFAQSSGMLIAVRAVQGLGGAIVSPAALSIVSTAFSEGSERNKALGIWGALGGSGAAVGVLLGGILTEYLGWEWIFFVNVPVGALVIALSPLVVHESRLETKERRFDPLGAISVTVSLVLLVYAISKAPDNGWGSGQTIGLLIGFVVLLAAFVFIESRERDPLMPLGIFRVRTVAGANVVGILLGGSLFSMFFLLTLYVQQVLHYSAIKTGITFLATAGTAIVAAGIAQELVNRVGTKVVMSIGLALMAAALFWYTQISVHGSFAADLLGGYVLAGVGIAFSFVPVSIAALAGVPASEAGLASGLINTSQQVGGAIGTAVASTVFTQHAAHLLAALHRRPTFLDQANALTSGFRLGFWVIAFVAVAGIVATLLMIRREEAVPEEVPVAGATSPFSPNRAAAATIVDDAAPERPDPAIG